MPAAEVDITGELVRALLEEQHPDLAALPLAFAGEGWDSVIYRLGDDLAVRLPRRTFPAALLPVEFRWLPVIETRLPLAVNAPVRVGEPGEGFPWPWSVSKWFDGESWADVDVRDPFEAATVLGMFVRALAVDAPDELPTSPFRGGPLTDRDQPLRDRVAQLHTTIDVDAVMAIWNDALTAPVATQRLWVHGDLHPAYIVVRDGVLSAVIDWADMSAGDVAYDLAAAWFCFSDPAARAVFASSTGIDDEATWIRARGCALSWSLAVLANAADNPRMHAVGERTLDAVLAP